MVEIVDYKIYNDGNFNSLTSQQVQTIPNVVLSTTPVGRAGSIVYDVDTELIYFSDGLSWLAVGTGGGVSTVSSGTGITVDNTDPVNPIVNITDVGPGTGTTVGPSSITINDQGQITAILGGGGGAVTGTTATPAGATSTLSNPITIATDSACIVRTTVVGRNLVTGEVNAFIATNAVKDVSGVLTKLGVFDDLIPFQENLDTNVVITVVGNDVEISVTGTAAAGMDWSGSTTVLCET